MQYLHYFYPFNTTKNIPLILKRKFNKLQYDALREDFPLFTYQSYAYKLIHDSLHVEFIFRLSDQYVFKPRLVFHDRESVSFARLSHEDLNNFVFHIGMVELVSYWKLACPPVVKIVPHGMDKAQLSWWKKLYFHGLGEFFYLNGIEPDLDNFMQIHAEGSQLAVSDILLDDHKIIVPIGGGKDSVVSLELLKKGDWELIPMMLNPRAASERTVQNAGFVMADCMVVTRHLDPLMLELNPKGFLNGHTPFSALLAFVALFTALASGSKHIALSNEYSANQTTVPGTSINHQYSKSFEFEQDFVWYARHYLHKDINYFSLLRPLSELQIASLFARFTQHFNSFRSCNVGSKVDRWCGTCPKCLFTYIILSPFVPKQQLLEIFGNDLLDDDQLDEIFKELNGQTDIKPFECVGTPDEVNLALWKHYKLHEDNVGVLLKRWEQQNTTDYSGRFEAALKAFNTKHFLTESFEYMIKNQLND